MLFLEEKNVSALHIAALPGFYSQLPYSLWLGLCRVRNAAETNVPVGRLSLLREPGWSSQQLLSSGCPLGALREKHRGFSTALQEENLSMYWLRLPYGCATSGVLPFWKAAHQPPVKPAALQSAGSTP